MILDFACAMDLSVYIVSHDPLLRVAQILACR